MTFAILVCLVCADPFDNVRIYAPRGVEVLSLDAPLRAAVATLAQGPSAIDGIPDGGYPRPRVVETFTPIADAVAAIGPEAFDATQGPPPGMPTRDRLYVGGLVLNLVVATADVDSSARCFEHNERPENKATGRRVCVEKVWPHSAFQDTPYFGLVGGAVTAGALYFAHRLHRSGEEMQARGQPGGRGRKLAANILLYVWASTRAVTVIKNWDTLARVRAKHP